MSISPGRSCGTWAAIWRHGKRSPGWSASTGVRHSCWKEPNPNHEVISLSWWVSNKLLYLFALADTRGRNTAEMGRPEENLHFWKLARRGDRLL